VSEGAILVGILTAVAMFAGIGWGLWSWSRKPSWHRASYGPAAWAACGFLGGVIALATFWTAVVVGVCAYWAGRAAWLALSS
jgi:hypothetical protein